MTISKVVEKILQYENIAITFHASPDGDALGSSLALFQILRKLNKNAYIISKEILPEGMEFLPYSQEVNKMNRSVTDETQCVIVLDCGNVERINGELDINNRNYFLMNIDHHLSNDLYGDINYVDTKSASVGEIVFEIMELLKVQLDKDIAKCIYTSILTDTGCFKYSNTSKKTHDFAGRLISTGIDFTEIHRVIFDNKSFSKIKLYGEVISTMQLAVNEKVCIMYITKKIIEDLKLQDEDTSDVITFGMKIHSVEVTVLLKEKEDGVKVSLRSKNYVDVRKIAESFGGGGHTRAAGFATNTNIEETVEYLKEILSKEMV